MTAIANVMCPLKVQRMALREAEAVAMNALQKVGLDGFANRQISGLPGGQRQRVALARAIVFEPRVMRASLTDERLHMIAKCEVGHRQKLVGH
jgi:putative spermidine/putrescine transport system ATP-binding protein